MQVKNLEQDDRDMRPGGRSHGLQTSSWSSGTKLRLVVSVSMLGFMDFGRKGPEWRHILGASGCPGGMCKMAVCR